MAAKDGIDKMKMEESYRASNADGMLVRAGEAVSSLLDGFSSSSKKVKVLSLSGIIGKAGRFQNGLTLENLNTQIEQAFPERGSNIEAVCMIVNSPGGSPVQSELIAARIRMLADKTKTRLYAFIEDMGASGGYWIACAADEIYASRSSIVGSIGVISRNFGFHKAIEKLGVERRVYHQGKNKSVLDPFQPERPEDLKIVKKIQQEIYEHFVDYVKLRRGGKLTQDDDVLFTGEFWGGKIALDYGLIDGIADMYSFIEDKFGSDVKIEHIKTKESWFKKKLTGSEVAGGDIAQSLARGLIDALHEEEMQSKFRMF